MAEMKHTPGDWQRHDDEHCPEEIWGNLESYTEDGVRGTLVCTIEDGPEAWANGQLILAAPKLLSAIQMAMRILPLWKATGKAENSSEDAALDLMERQFRDAIARATGHKH